MTLAMRHCTNPSCNAAYTQIEKGKPIDHYDEVIVRVRYNSGRIENRVISVCKKCKSEFNPEMAETLLHEVIEHETKELDNDALIEKDVKRAKMIDLGSRQIMAIGKNVDELKQFGKRYPQAYNGDFKWYKGKK